MIRDEIAEIQPIVNDVTDKQDIIKVVDQYRDTRFAAINIISEIQKQTPKDVALESVTVDVEAEEKQVQLSCVGKSRTSVSALINSLDQSPVLTDVKLEGPTKRDDEIAKYKFSVNCTLEKKE
jgi:Tfp pilus assembly protein PilN